MPTYPSCRMSDQRTLFEEDPTPWDMDDDAERLVASVVFVDGPDQDFSYLVPTHLAGLLEPGQRVRAPLGRGNRTAVGYCVRVETREIGPRRLKELLAVVDDLQWVDEPSRAAILFVARRVSRFHDALVCAARGGELPETEVTALMRELREDGEALETWRHYHLISDALRDTQLLSSGFSARLAARLADEPTVLAPVRALPKAEPRRWLALSAAASVAAVALVGWLAFAPQPGLDTGQVQIAQTPARVANVASASDAVPLPPAANDYLIAHQSYSPRNSPQGVAPYVRTVSETALPR